MTPLGRAAGGAQPVTATAPGNESPVGRASLALVVLFGGSLLASGGAALLVGSDSTRPPPAAIKLQVDPNSASATELELLPGVGPRIAEKIVAQRAMQPFQTAADLDEVPYIGPKTIERLRSLLALPDGAAPTSAAP